MRLTPRIEVEFADTAVGLAAAGLGDTYIPRVLVRSLDPRLHATGFDPPLVDVFALVSRAGSRLSAPVRDLVDRLVDHLVAMAGG